MPEMGAGFEKHSTAGKAFAREEQKKLIFQT
jgi:hypothetical protein